MELRFNSRSFYQVVGQGYASLRPAPPRYARGKAAGASPAGKAVAGCRTRPYCFGLRPTGDKEWL